MNISTFISISGFRTVKYTGGRLVTATERLLVYLLDYRTYEGEMEGPIDITQMRIAEALGITVGNVSRTGKPLIKDGLVGSHKVHVQGIRQKRGIYYLLPDGRGKARKARDRITAMELTYVDKGGNQSETARAVATARRANSGNARNAVPGAIP